MKTKQINDYHIVQDALALSTSVTTQTKVILASGLKYNRVTSSATADGVLVISVANSSSDRWQIQYDGTPIPVQAWGAVGNGTVDDTLAISNALNSAAPAIVFNKTANYYKVTNLITVSNLSVKRIFADGATILNSDLSKQTFLFQDCANITVSSGLWGQVTMPTANSGASQHIFQFNRCTDVEMNRVFIDKSGEMGVAFTSCNRYSLTGCSISHTMRDGCYSRYCANGKVVFCNFSNIKDDAISFHDKDNPNAGVDAEKTNTLVNVYGYTQASNFLAAFNVIDTAYEGIVSVGGANVEVDTNTISNTVLAAVCLYNQKNDDPAGILNGFIHGNKITAACTTTTINGTSFPNNGQSGPGRAAIFVGSTGTNNQVNMGETKRLSQVKVTKNTVFSSGGNGFWANLTDGLEMETNKFLNTIGADPAHSGAGMGTVVEIQNCTYLNAVGNEVTDNRGTIKHIYGYNLFNTTGYSDRWVVNGFLTGESILNGTTVVTNMASRQNMPQPLPSVDSAGTVDWNTYQQPGVRQVAGASVGTAANNPFANAANAGSLHVELSLGTLTQTYTDYLGNQVFRHLNGTPSGTWSAWIVQVTGANFTTLIGTPMGIPVKQLNFIAASSATSWNTYKSAGAYQVVGDALWNQTAQAPTNAYNAGTLFVAISRDTIEQLYLDVQSNLFCRMTNGFAGDGFGGVDNWSAWRNAIGVTGMPVQGSTPVYNATTNNWELKSTLITSSVVANTFQAISNSLIITNNTSQKVVITLPTNANSNVGDPLIVGNLGGLGWTIAQNAGDQIIGPTAKTTVGTGGSLSSSGANPTVSLRKVAANTWLIFANEGAAPSYV